MAALAGNIGERHVLIFLGRAVQVDIMLTQG
jgi:hypothetical protein